MKRNGDTIAAAPGFKTQRKNAEQPPAPPLPPSFEFFSELAASYHASNTLQEALVKMSRDITQESKKVGFLLQRTTPSNRSQIVQEAEAALRKVRSMVRAQFAAMPPRDVLRYNKSIGWSHQEFVEAWGLWRYVIGSRAPMFREFQDWLNTEDDADLGAEGRVTTDEVRARNAEAHPRMSVTLFDFILGLFDVGGEVMRLCVASVATLSQDAGAPFRALEYVQALQHALTAGSGSVDLKEYEKKNTVLQQCREKIESVCFDLRLRKAEFPHIDASAFSIGQGGGGGPEEE